MHLRALIRATLAAASFAPGIGFAQSVPNASTAPIVQGATWTPAQWQNAWTSKVDTTNGVLTNPTLINPTTQGLIKPEFNVSAYGAKCDGSIIYGGVSTTSGSPAISTPTYSFTQADVGATITLSVAPFNSYSSGSLPAFSSTIQSVSGGVATMAANSTFTSSGAAARWYHTVDTAAIQAALNAAAAALPGGGEIRFPAGVCASGPLTLFSNDYIIGSSNGASVILLANNSNSDLFTGQNFSTLTGTNSTGGVKDWGFQNIQLDGNRGANTGSSIGTASGVGHAIRVYGYEFTMDNVLANNFAGDAFYTEWSTSAGSPVDANNNIGPDGMEAHVHDVKCAYGAGWCFVWNGPHDSLLSYITTISMGTGGILNYAAANGSPLTISYYHGYQEPVDLNLETNATCIRCFSEGLSILNNYNFYIFDSLFNTLQLGTSGGSTVYNLLVGNTSVTTLSNLSGSGFQDQWANSIVGTATGTAYSPSTSINNRGLTNSLNGSMQIYTGASYPAVFAQNSSSQFTFTNTGSTQWTNAGNANTFSGSVSAASYATATRCASGASPAVCAASAAGSVAIPTGTSPTLVVDTSAVTANSQIILTVDETRGTALGVTCNTTLTTLPAPLVTARTAGTSFTIQLNATVATNPACVDYMIIN